VTAFIGRAQQGPIDEPVRIASFADFEREFGGLWRASRMSYSVQQYFLNGGREALIVRVDNGALDIGDEQVATGASLETERKGLWALEKADLVRLLCIPPCTDHRLRTREARRVRGDRDPAESARRFGLRTLCSSISTRSNRFRANW